VENASVAMHWVGPDGVILWANRAELDMLGFTAEEYIGRHISEFHVDQAVIDDILQRLTNRETLQSYDATLRCKDGSVRHTLISSNVLWEGDKFIHTRCITRDVTELVQNHAQIAILGREAEHRAKNVLATVQATIELTHADTPDDFKRAIKGRVQALANAHNLFVQSRWTGAELRDLVTQELSPYCRDGETRAWVEGENVLLEPTAAQALAVCVHELTTNAAKYGALSVAEGRVQIEWSHTADGRLVLHWTETNGPPVRPPTRRGFGTRAMEAMIRGQLNGDVRFDWRAEGLVCEIALTT
jgi:PAS domain S-box-containing protein